MQKPRRLVLTQVPERSEEACNEALKQLPAWFNQIAFRQAHHDSTPLPLPIALSPDEARLAHLEKLLTGLGYGCAVEVGAEPVAPRRPSPAQLPPTPLVSPEPSSEPAPAPERTPSAPPDMVRRPTPATALDAPAEGAGEGPAARRGDLGSRETMRLPAQDEERVPPAMLARAGVLGVLIVALCVLILRMGGGVDQAAEAPARAGPAWESVSGPTAHAPIPLAFLTFFIGIGVVGMIANALGIWRPVAPGRRRPRLDTKVGLFGLGLLGAGYVLLLTTSWNPTEKLEAQKRRPPPVFAAPSPGSATPDTAAGLSAAAAEPTHPAWAEIVVALPGTPDPEVTDPVFTQLFEVLLPGSTDRQAGQEDEQGSCASRMDTMPAFSRLACRLEVDPPLPDSDPTFRSLLASVMPKPPTPKETTAPPAPPTEGDRAVAPAAAPPKPPVEPTKAPAQVAAAKAPPPALRPPDPPSMSRDEVMKAWRLGALRLMALVFLLGVLVGGIIAFLLRLLVRLYEREAQSS